MSVWVYLLNYDVVVAGVVAGVVVGVVAGAVDAAATAVAAAADAATAAGVVVVVRGRTEKSGNSERMAY